MKFETVIVYTNLKIKRGNNMKNEKIKEFLDKLKNKI